MLFAIVVGIPLGMLSAIRRNSPIDVGTMMFANLGVSIPVFVLGLVSRVPLRGHPEGHALRAAAVGPAELRRRGDPARRGLGASGPVRHPSRHPRLRLGICTCSAASSAVNGARPVDAFRHLILPAVALGDDPDGDHRPDHPLEPARGARPGLRPDRTGQGAREQGRSSSAMPSATRCCPSSPSSACSSAPCCRARS